MKEETIYLDNFEPRDYQKPLFKAIFKDGYKKVIAIWPRRSGKDLSSFHIAEIQCLLRVGTVYDMFPTAALGRRIIWDAIDNDGNRIIDSIPKQLVESRNEQLMRIRFVNGSVYQILGSDRYDKALIGTNAMGFIFSEFAQTDPMAFKLAMPIINASDGWILVQSTPRGKNFFFDLYKIAKDNPDKWFCQHLTIDDTKHIPIEKIQEDIRTGIISEDLALQEYWCSFELGVEGSYYSNYIDKMQIERRIGDVLWDSSLLVHTAWDIGHDDATAIIFFQVVNNAIYIIDYYEKSKEAMDHYIAYVKSKPYMYGKHIGPHDIKVTEYSDGLKRIEKAARLGLDFIVAPKLEIEDGIETVRSTLPRVYIDKVKGERVIKCLENYRQEFDPKKRIYKGKPRHDEFSHCADAMRYLCSSLKMLIKGMTADDIRKMVKEAHFGSESNTPDIFRNNNSFPW